MVVAGSVLRGGTPANAGQLARRRTADALRRDASGAFRCIFPQEAPKALPITLFLHGSAEGAARRTLLARGADGPSFVAARSAAFNRCVSARSAGAFRCILFSQEAPKALPVALGLCGSHRRAAWSLANRRAGLQQSCSSLARRPAAGAAKPDACEAAAARAPARASSGLVGPEEGLQLRQHHGQLKLLRQAQPATRVVQLLTGQRVR